MEGGFIDTMVTLKAGNNGMRDYCVHMYVYAYVCDLFTVHLSAAPGRKLRSVLQLHFGLQE